MGRRSVPNVHLAPIEVARIAPRHPALGVEGEQVKPAMVEQGADTVMAGKDRGHGLPRGLDADGQPQRCMGQGPAVMHGLPGQPDAQRAAIAFDQPANVVDGNVERVMARLFAIETPLPAAKTEIRRRAAGFIDPMSDRHGDWAQALMDLGATVCRPGVPDCEACPLAQGCAARAAGTPGRYPLKVRKAARPHRHGVVWIALREGAVALVRRPDKGLLGGMMALPTSDWRDRPWSLSEMRACAPAKADWHLAGSVEHVFTHFSLTLDVYVGEAEVPGAEWRLASDAGTGLPTVFAKALQRGLA